MNETNGKQNYLCLQPKLQDWDVPNHTWTTPSYLGEVYLTNEFRCAHNHHQIRIRFHTHPLYVGK
jgi:hypothetical protein